MSLTKYIWTEEELPQGSDKWHAWRKEGNSIGASSVAVLVWESKYSNIQIEWEYRTGARPPKAWSAVMQQGNEKEPLARSHYESKYGLVEPLCAVHPDYPWMRASFDAVKIDRTAIAEIKCPKNLKNHHLQTRKGEVPLHRRAQLQWQLAIANRLWGIEEAHYFSYWSDKDDEHKRIIVPYDRERAALLIRRGEIFKGYVDRNERPPYNLFREDANLIAIGGGIDG